MKELGSSSTWSETPKGTAREGDRRDMRRTFKLLRKVWLNIGVEKTDTYEGILVKALLDNGAMEMFMDRKFVAKHSFRLLKLERPLLVRNVDRMSNSRGSITHEVEVNVYYKNYMERMKMNVCDLGKTSVILGIPWLQAYNLEINWKTREVKMMRCLPLCRRNSSVKKKKKVKKKRQVVILEEEKMVRWTVDNKEDWEREEKVEQLVCQAGKVYVKSKKHWVPRGSNRA